jgi:hypothetical protein
MKIQHTELNSGVADALYVAVKVRELQLFTVGQD